MVHRVRSYQLRSTPTQRRRATPDGNALIQYRHALHFVFFPSRCFLSDKLKTVPSDFGPAIYYHNNMISISRTIDLIPIWKLINEHLPIFGEIAPGGHPGDHVVSLLRRERGHEEVLKPAASGELHQDVIGLHRQHVARVLLLGEFRGPPGCRRPVEPSCGMFCIGLPGWKKGPPDTADDSSDRPRVDSGP